MKKENLSKAVEFGSALAMCVSAACAATSLCPNTGNKLFRVLHPVGFALIVSPIIYQSSRYWARIAEQAYDTLNEEEEEQTNG